MRFRLHVGVRSLSLLLVLLSTSGISRARADFVGANEIDSDDSPVVLPVEIVSGSDRSGAEREALADRSLEVHSAWLRKLAEHPETPELVKAARRNPFANHPEKLRCWVSGFSAVIGAQAGVCKGAGRRYAFSAVGFGVSSEIHSGRLRLVSDRPIPEDGLTLSGNRESIHVLLGFEAYQLSNSKSSTAVNGRGFGAGIGAATELVWVMITRID